MAIHRMASSGRTGLRIASGVPGRGSRKLTGTSVGASSASWPISSRRWAVVSPMPRRTPQHSCMPTSRRGGTFHIARPSVWVVDDLREKRPGRLEVVVVAVDTARGQALGLGPVEDSRRHRHVEPGGLLDHGNQIQQTSHRPLVRTANRQHDAELAGAHGRPFAGRPRAPDRCRGRGWRARGCRSATTGRRSGSPPGSPRSWPTGCPRSRRSRRTRPGEPRGPARPATGPARPAPRPGPPAAPARSRCRRLISWSRADSMSERVARLDTAPHGRTIVAAARNERRRQVAE